MNVKIIVPKYPLNHILKYIQSGNVVFRFRNLRPNLLGESIPLHDHETKHEADIVNLSVHIRVEELPAVIIHECLHLILPEPHAEQLVLQLERRILRTMTQKQINKLLHIVLAHSCWIWEARVKRNVGSQYD